MPPILALIIGFSLVIVLLFIERRYAEPTSLAFWIPTVWVLINASRPLGRWFLMGGSDVTIETGSPLDRWVLTILIFLALVVLFRRKTQFFSKS